MSDIRKKLAGKVTKLAEPRETLTDHPATPNDYDNGSFVQIEIDLIHPDPNQPRQYFDETTLNELSQSIKQKGILQPVIIRKDKENKIWLVAGERRYRAAKMAEQEKIPAMLTTGNPAEIALIENIQRENLKPVEEAEALARMIDKYEYTQEQLSQVIGKARSTVTETLSLNKLPAEIKDECRRTDNFPRRLLLEISKQETPEAMVTLFNQVKEGNLKSDQLRKITRKNTKRTMRTPAAIALDRTAQLANYLPKIDLNNTEENEKVKLLTELQYLNRLITDFVN